MPDVVRFSPSASLRVGKLRWVSCTGNSRPADFIRWTVLSVLLGSSRSGPRAFFGPQRDPKCAAGGHSPINAYVRFPCKAQSSRGSPGGGPRYQQAFHVKLHRAWPARTKCTPRALASAVGKPPIYGPRANPAEFCNRARRPPAHTAYPSHLIRTTQWHHSGAQAPARAFLSAPVHRCFT